MSHAIVRTEDDTRLLHTCAGPCAEGEYVQREGLSAYEMWPPGNYPVSFYSFFDDDGEYDAGLQLTYEDVPDGQGFPSYSDPQPTGRVLGFPYQGGRWAG